MRLINVKTLQLGEFFGTEIPQYAILSHRWEAEEVSFQDMMSADIETLKRLLRYQKIVGCCKLAARDELEWVWIDSCCIDKSSSAELSEAINSMFRWYRDADMCYAYLSDVSGPLEERKNMDAFRFSKWFTRGWTLQELLAPDELMFADKDWQEIGTMEGLSDTISAITVIKHLFSFEDASVAQKMSWAAKRETTRREDEAYCLMGLFGVNMPLLYGEGDGAFLRLQLEIMKISSDESLFAWEDSSVTSSGLLAASPASFKYASDIKPLDVAWIQRPPYAMTNKGLEIQLHLAKWDSTKPFRVSADLTILWLAPLNCVRESYGLTEPSVLSVALQQDTNAVESYQRVLCQSLRPYDWPPKSFNQDDDATAERKIEKVYIPQSQMQSGIQNYCYFQIDTRQLYLLGWIAKDRYVLHTERGRWGRERERKFSLKLSNSSAGIILLDLHGEAVMLKVSCAGQKIFIKFLSLGQYFVSQSAVEFSKFKEPGEQQGDFRV